MLEFCACAQGWKRTVRNEVTRLTKYQHVLPSFVEPVESWACKVFPINPS
jgi:hypothetical protein